VSLGRVRNSHSRLHRLIDEVAVHLLHGDDVLRTTSVPFPLIALRVPGDVPEFFIQRGS
jgi:hypothetical protein